MPAPTETPPTELTRNIATFVSSFTLADPPARAVRNAKTLILDCLGVSVAATRQEIGTCIASFARDHVATGPCTVWGTGIRADIRDAVLLNGTLAHGLDFDDSNHSSTVSLPAPFALAERFDLSGARLLESFILAREVRNALDRLFVDRNEGVGPGAKGWHSNGVLGPIASACGAAKMLSLDVEQVTHVIGLAAGSCGALTRDGGTMAKPFRVGHAAATGLTCALLAKSGATADDQAIEGRFGLIEALGPMPDTMLAGLGRDLGKVYRLDSDIRVKRYAACWATLGGIEAMLRLVRRQPIDPAAVVGISCDLKPYPLLRALPRRGGEGRFSMAFCLAVALRNGTIEAGDFSDATVGDPMIQKLMTCTRHVPGATALSLTLANGREVVEPLQPRGSLQTWDEVVAKFRNNTLAILGEDRAAQVVSSVADIETQESVRRLAQALTADVDG